MTSRSAICLSAVALALGAVAAMNVVRAESELRCPQTGLPIETLGSEKAQRVAIYQQARAYVKDGKPLQAVALLSQIIKSDPTAAVAYLNRGRRPRERRRWRSAILA